ncbi:MAG: hypothetical protein AAF845_18245 [Bacteroidota bacterium]
MRLLVLLALLGTASASAQVSADSLARLDAEVARTEAALRALAPQIQANRDTLDALRAAEADLDAERAAFQGRVRDYTAASEALATRSDSAQVLFEQIQAGAPEVDRVAYEAEVAALTAESDRLATEAEALNALQADLNARYRLHAASVREAAEAGRALIVERRRVNEAAVTLAARRARLGGAE